MASTFTIQGPRYTYPSSGAVLNMQVAFSQAKDIANNRSTITWTLKVINEVGVTYCTAAPTTVFINGTAVVAYGLTSYSTMQFPAAGGSVSGTFTVNHDANGGCSVNVRLSSNFYEHTPLNYPSAAGATWTLDSIARQANITSAPDFNDTGNPTIYYSNPAGNAVTALDACISLNGSADVAYRAVSKTGSSYTFNLTDAERNTLRNGVSSTSKTKTVTFYLRTTIGSNVFYSTVAKTFTITESDTTRPTVSHTISVIDNISASAFDGILLQGIGQLSVSVTASGKYNATISSRSTSADGKSYSGTSVTTDVIQSSGSIAVTTTVTDSRGFKKSVTSYITSNAYTNPQLKAVSGENTVRCYRSDNSGQQSGSSNRVWLKARAEVQSVTVDGTNINTYTMQYSWKTSSGSSWSQFVNLTTVNDVYNALLSQTYDVTASYNIRIRIYDAVGRETSIIFDIPTEEVFLSFADNGGGIGIGRYADGYPGSERFSVAWESFFENGINGIHRLERLSSDYNSPLAAAKAYAESLSTTYEYGFTPVFYEADMQNVQYESAVGFITVHPGPWRTNPYGQVEFFTVAVIYMMDVVRQKIYVSSYNWGAWTDKTITPV